LKFQECSRHAVVRSVEDRLCVEDYSSPANRGGEWIMASLYEILDNAHDGEGVTTLSREFDLTPAQTQAAITALLPAISMGLKQSTATVDGLGKLLGMMGQQQDLHEMYEDSETAFGSEGVAAGNDALSVIFGSPQVSRAVVDQAQKASGVSADILKKLLPVIAGVVLSGLMRSGSTPKSARPEQPAPSGGSLGDILGQIFGRGTAGAPGLPADRGQQSPPPDRQSPPISPSSTDTAPEGDLLGTILRELQKGIQEGRIKPVIIGGGPVQIPLPQQQRPLPPDPQTQQMPGGDVLGQILRDIFGGGMGQPGQIPQGREGGSPQMKDLSDRSKQLGLMGGAGAAVFGDHFEVGRDVDQRHTDDLQRMFERFFGAPPR
jgi:hypothetical protein